eukprot:1613587-Rhodomonas_salina.2
MDDVLIYASISYQAIDYAPVYVRHSCIIRICAYFCVADVLICASVSYQAMDDVLAMDYVFAVDVDVRFVSYTGPLSLRSLSSGTELVCGTFCAAQNPGRNYRIVGSALSLGTELAYARIDATHSPVLSSLMLRAVRY